MRRRSRSEHDPCVRPAKPRRQGDHDRARGARCMRQAGRLLDDGRTDADEPCRRCEILARFGATLDHVVEETLYVLDVDEAFSVAGKLRKEAYAKVRPQCANNLIGVRGWHFLSSSSKSSSRQCCHQNRLRGPTEDAKQAQKAVLRRCCPGSPSVASSRTFVGIKRTVRPNSALRSSASF
jgi:hypothetical protein